MAYDGFLKIGDLVGESSDLAHRGWIEILSFEHETKQPTGPMVSIIGGRTGARVAMGDFNWACFAAQQAADKAAKALHLHQGTVAWGHSVRELLEAFPAEASPSEELKDSGRNLDRHYVASRYPNAHPSGGPRQSYAEDDARRAIDDAEKVVSWCDQGFPSEP